MFRKKSHKKFSLSDKDLELGSFDVELSGLHGGISNNLMPTDVSELFWKKSGKSGKSRKSGGKVPISGERIGVKSPSTRRFSLRIRPRLRAKFEPDRSSR